MTDWDNNNGENWGEPDRVEQQSVPGDQSEHRKEEMLDSVEEVVAAPRNAKREDFTWKDMADFANFAIAYNNLSIIQRDLLIRLAGVRKDADAADIGVALLKNTDKTEAITILAPIMNKVVHGEADMMDAVELSNSISSTTDAGRLGVLRVLNAALETIGEHAIQWQKSRGAADLTNRVVKCFPKFEQRHDVLSLITVLGDIMKMWPGER